MGQYLFRLSDRWESPEFSIIPVHVFLVVSVLIGLSLIGFLMTTSSVKAESTTAFVVNYNADYPHCQVDRPHVSFVGLSGCPLSQSVQSPLVLNSADNNLSAVYVKKSNDLFERSRDVVRDPSKVPVDTPKWVWGLIAVLGGCAIASAIAYKGWLRRRSGR